MHAWAGHDERRPAPLILGHEAAGEIIGFGGAVRRVTVNPLVTCGKCEACLSGRDNLCSQPARSYPCHRAKVRSPSCLAMPEGNLVKFRITWRWKVRRCANPLACGWHAVRLGEGSAWAENLAGGPLSRPGRRCNRAGSRSGIRAQGGKEVMIVEPNAARRNRIIETEDIKCLPASQMMMTRRTW